MRKFGGNVLLHGANYDEAQAEAMRLVESEGRTLIHPFDDPHVIAGQGTIGERDGTRAWLSASGACVRAPRMQSLCERCHRYSSAPT